MAAILGGAAIAGAATLVSAGIQAWYNYDAMESASKATDRTNKLNIKFAEEESVREESRFNRNLKLSKENLVFQKRQSGVQTTQQILGNIQNLMQSNRNNSMQMMNFSRGRR